MVKTNNPAGRLYRLLAEARAKETNNHSLLVWAEVLEAVDGSEASTLHRFLQLIQLFHETKAALEGVKDLNRDLYMSEMHRIENLMFPSTLFRPWNGVKNSLTDTAMQALAFCAERLSELPLHRDADPHALAQLQADVEALSERVIGSDEIDTEAKGLLVDLLNILREALIEYRIRGPARLREAVEQLVGKLVVNRSKVERNQSAAVVIEFGRLWTRFTEIVGLVSDINQLAPAATDLIRGLLPP
jgi:hypothetical protein